jgi:hypothetical protein
MMKCWCCLWVYYDQAYQVGEFGNDGVDATVVTGTDSSQQLSPKFSFENAEKPD